MPTSPAKSFRATLEPLHNGLSWVIARVPFDVAKAWPIRKGRRVRGQIDGLAIRTSLLPDPGGKTHFILVNKKMRSDLHVSVGSRVQISLQPDLEDRPAQLPPELALALKGDCRLRKFFDALTPSVRKGIGDFVNQPKSAASREKRADAMAERLLLALEGEKEIPPILLAAFQRQPLARTGWSAMSPTQRRHHLLGIFYYQNAEARERRAIQAVEVALRIAPKRSSMAP